MRQLISPQGWGTDEQKCWGGWSVVFLYSKRARTFRYKTWALRHPTVFNFYNWEICLNITCMHHLYDQKKKTFQKSRSLKFQKKSPFTSCDPKCVFTTYISCECWSRWWWWWGSLNSKVIMIIKVHIVGKLTFINISPLLFRGENGTLRGARGYNRKLDATKPKINTVISRWPLICGNFLPRLTVFILSE